MNKHFNITVRGKVQGVFYRVSAKKVADIMGLNGFVRNEPSGDVYAEVEGEEELLIKFVHWCHNGPDKAVVESVSVTDGALKGFSSFEIKETVQKSVSKHKFDIR
jgi:acylphosphatase